MNSLSLDLLREIVLIGLGKANFPVADLLHQKITITSPLIEDIPGILLSKLLPFEPECEPVIVHFSLEHTLQGDAYFLFPSADPCFINRLVFGNQIKAIESHQEQAVVEIACSIMASIQGVANAILSLSFGVQKLEHPKVEFHQILDELFSVERLEIVKSGFVYENISYPFALVAKIDDASRELLRQKLDAYIA